MTKGRKSPGVWRIAAKSIGFAVLMGCVALAMVFGANSLQQLTDLEQSKAKAAMVASNAALQNTQSDRARLEDNLLSFRRLKATRFTQAPDRLRLIEAMEKATQNMQRNALEWEIKPQEKVKVLSDDKTGAPVAQLVRVRMQLRATGVHEEEWLGLLNQLRETGAGHFAVDSCAYDLKAYSRSHAFVPAINVLCQLSWLYAVAESTGMPTVAPSGAPIPAAIPSLGLVRLPTAILTPAQRRTLELARKLPAFEPGQAGTSQFTELFAAEPVAAISQKLAISGVVVREGNRSTVWINDQPLYGAGDDSPLRVLAKNAGILQPSAKSAGLPSKPGKTVDSSTREAVDLLPQGAIVINKPARVMNESK